MLPWGGNISQFCANPQEQIGASCDAGEDGDVILADCSCGNYTPPCNHPDYPALEEFYNATNGTTWFPATNWLQDCEPCGWDGILCNNAGRVISIDLTNRFLSGELPEDLDGLPLLKRLKITDNGVTGNIPPGLFTHPRLKAIDLGNNEFTGEIPAIAGGAPLLLYLIINDNLLTGELPEGVGYGNLREFHAFGNDLSGCIPDSYFEKCDRDFRLGDNPKLPWWGNFNQFCSRQPQFGAGCDDGDPLTSVDRINSNCECVGNGDTDEEEDCDGLIGTRCDDGNPETIRDVIQDDCNCRGATSTIILDDDDGVLDVYPNPTDDEVIIDFPRGTSNITILSGGGKSIKQFSPSGLRMKIDVSDLAPGLYLISASGKEGRTVKKLIVR